MFFFYIFTYNFLKISFYTGLFLAITNPTKKELSNCSSRSEVMRQHTFQRLIYIYLMTLSRFVVTQCGCVDGEYQCSRKLRFRHYYLWLFLQVALPHIPPLWVLEVHINDITRITIYITDSKIHFNYSENHDSPLFFYYFYVSILPTLAHTIAKGSTFSISSLFDLTNLIPSFKFLMYTMEAIE